MGLIALDDALLLLKVHEEAITALVREAWNSLRSLPKEQLLVLDATARANIVSCQMRFRATKYFESVGVPVYEYNRALLFLLGGRLALRFKKLDDELRSSNIPTRQVAAMRGQLPLPGIGDVSFIDVGYVLDREQLDIERICAVCLNGDEDFWEYDLVTGSDISKVHHLFPATEFKELHAEVRGKPHVIERRRKANEGEAES
jgi:hypothetical protein